MHTKKAYSIQFSISTIFVVLISSIAIVIVLLSYFRFNRTLTETAHRIVQQTSTLAHDEVTDYLAPLTRTTALTAKLVADGVIDISNTKEILDYGRELLRLDPQLVSTYWANPKGDLIGVNRRSDNKFFLLKILRGDEGTVKTAEWVDDKGKPLSEAELGTSSYDPRKRPWYTKANTRKEVVWSSIYRFAGELSGNTNILGITAAAPVYDAEGDVLLGVFGVDIQLEDISKFLSRLEVSEHSVSFIINDKGEFIIKPQFTKQNNIQPMDKFHLPTKWVSNSFEQFKKGSHDFFTFSSNNKNYIASYHRLDSIVGEPWYVGVVLPEDDFLGEIKRINTIVFITYFLVMIIGIWLVYLFSLRISKPIKDLVEYTKKVSKLELDESFKQHSRVKEVYLLQDALKAMSDGLRSFQKYVPASLVRRLVESGEEPKVGGETMPVTVLFTDLENFTHFSETISPHELMERLSEYFEESTRIIIDNKGTIDKFIGDSIMAFWGAPEVDYHQTLHACNAALALKVIMNDERHPVLQSNEHAIITHIGVHVGDAVVGNVGSSERLNYTAIGDAVNLASRLEGLNKIYGTQIIVSEVVYERVEKYFAFHFLDYVAVKGKEKATKIYELVGDARMISDKKHIRFNERFEKAFAAYQTCQWEEALTIFQALSKEYPEDKVTLVFIERCKIGAKVAPPPGWAGVWTYVDKF